MHKKVMNNNRFKDERENRFTISGPTKNDPVLIMCPKCSRKAVVVPIDEDPVWQVHLYGEMSLILVTTEFNWQLIELSEKEYDAVYA
ncbi:hypothetical protein KCM76_06780 [Zooshikella marina]|uniref:hypothetical protein n=1 Tax=Zooshikella ganghwensis TaxID=202772 RepID=UPI001BAFA377|nr:hypothetical protein [Zooshikella ganghwensis]MBU2705678.1 hypothetical protein [Zooshikella ganghwensis]